MQTVNCEMQLFDIERIGDRLNTVFLSLMLLEGYRFLV